MSELGRLRLIQMSALAAIAGMKQQKCGPALNYLSHMAEA